MPLLYYWRPDNYARDQVFGFGYHLNQNSAALADVAAGDSVWAFTRRRRDGLYALASELVVRAVARNPPNYRYGRYRIWGDLARSRYFDLGAAPNAEPVIRRLSIAPKGKHLGQAFQGHAAVWRITPKDHQLLASLAQDLPVLERAAFYPEDELEARLLYGEEARSRVVRETPAAYGRRMDYFYASVDPLRARRNVEELQALYGGRCQLCLFDPRDQYGHRLCHGHHIQWLSRGGEDALANMVLICPNHHAAIHRDDAPFDYESLSFSFSVGRLEVLQLNEHLPQAA